VQGLRRRRPSPECTSRIIFKLFVMSQPSEPVPVRSRRSVFVIAILGGVFAWVTASAFEKVQHSQYVDELDASACFALYNANVLLGSSASVPSTDALKGALQQGPLAPVPVSVVQRSTDSLGVELQPSDAKAYPELANQYRTLSLSNLQKGDIGCPHTSNAQGILQRLVNAAYR
jgi:hypothetical protein